MTERQKQVISMIGQCLSLKEIASLLRISSKAVEFHWGNCKRLYGFRCYQDAAHYALAKGWIRNEFARDDNAREDLNDV
jgi:DNA-binding NarL/FixJ family response regulator